MPGRITDVTQLEGYILHSRRVALTRLVLVACFVVLLAIFTPWRKAMLGVLEFGLYLALFAAAEITAREPTRTRLSSGCAGNRMS